MSIATASHGPLDQRPSEAAERAPADPADDQPDERRATGAEGISTAVTSVVTLSLARPAATSRVMTGRAARR
jgi:hypothetical protein